MSVSVDLVSLMACAIILSEMYSIQAWFSGGLPYFLVKAVDEGLRRRHVERVIPDRRPGAAQIAFARRPGIGGVEVEADDRVGKAELGILLDQVGDLVAGEVGADDVGLGLPDLQQIGTEVGDVGGDQFVADQVAAVGVEEGFGGASAGRGRKCSRRSA